MSREKIFGYINTVKKERQLQDEENSVMESESYKLRKIAENTECCKNEVIGKIVGKLYIDSLPLDDDYKGVQADNLQNEMVEYIKDNGGSQYLESAIKRTGSNKLQKILETAKIISTRYALDKESNLETISSKDLDYNPTQEDDKDIDDAVDTLEFDDISDIIRTNVKNTILSEIDRAKKNDERQQALQDELANDEDITSNEDIDDAVESVGESTFYEATLFEAMMMKNVAGYVKEGYNGNDASDLGLSKSTKELTKINMLNTLMLESYSKQDLINLRDQYLKESL